MTQALVRVAPAGTLAEIPVQDCTSNFPIETLHAHRDRIDSLLDDATRRFPAAALRQLDAVSRRWLKKWDNAHLAEIDEVAGIIGRPGATFFSVNYEWGCTCRVAPSPDGRSARMVRVLDWTTPGLGRNVIAARVAGKSGSYVTLTWPGYTGVLTALAPQRFAAALNQAPMRKPIGMFYLDWAANRGRVWNMPHQMPAHLLRAVFEKAANYAEARAMLIEEPVSTPGIFSLTGQKPGETCVIERRETEARIHDGQNVASNHWQAAGWHGHPRGNDSAGRARQMHAVEAVFDPELPWLKPPVLNSTTRIVMVADASQGRMIAQGFEDSKPATKVLELNG